jgi:hypothetical protein
LEGLHYRMSSVAEVLRRVLARRRIATTNMSADQTLAQLHPALARLQALAATVVAGLNIRIGLLYVLTRRHATSRD